MVRLAVAADLFPVLFPGVKTSRNKFLVDVDLDRFKARIADYFDPALSHAASRVVAFAIRVLASNR